MIDFIFITKTTDTVHWFLSILTLGAGTGYERWLEDDLKVKNVIEEGWREEG